MKKPNSTREPQALSTDKHELVQAIRTLLKNNGDFDSHIRRDQIQAIADNLARGQQVVIHGIQRMGKTRTFKSAAALLPNHNTGLIEAIKFEKTDKLMPRIEALCEKLHSNIVICIDEIGCLGDGQEAVLVEINALRQKYSATFAFISHFVHDEEREEKRRNMFQRNGYTEYTVQPLTIEETSTYVHNYFSSLGFTYSDRTVRIIHDMSGGRILDICSIAAVMTMYALWQYEEVATSKIVDLTEEEVRSDTFPLSLLLLGETQSDSSLIMSHHILQASPKMQNLARSLMERRSIPAEEVEKSTDPRVIFQLMQVGYIRKNKDGTAYEINGELLYQEMLMAKHMIENNALMVSRGIDPYAS